MRAYESNLYLMRGRGGSPMFDSSAYYRGAGIGSIFSSIFSHVVPFIKGAFRVGNKVARSNAGKALKNQLKKSATKAGINIISDTLQGKNVLKSSKRQLTNVGNEMGKKLQAITSSSSKIKPKTMNKISRRGRKRPGSLLRGGFKKQARTVLDKDIWYR